MTVDDVITIGTWLTAGVLVAVAVGAQAAASRSRQQASPLPDTPLTESLLRRWRERAARWRSAAVLPAIAAAVAAGLIFRSSVGVGVGGPHPPWADPVLAGMVAALLGAIGAEMHHLRRARDDVRVADLAPRDVADLRPAGARTRQLLLTGLAALATAIAVTLPNVDVPGLGLGALIAAAGLPLAQRRIALRARPALSTTLRTADQGIRQLAIHSVDHAGAGLALLLAAWQLAPVYEHLAPTGPPNLALAGAQVTAFVIAFGWWRRSHPDRLTSQLRA